MFDQPGNDRITNALDELITCLGVKEEGASHDLVALIPVLALILIAGILFWIK